MKSPATRTLVALALQCAAVAALAAALLGVSWLDARSRPRLVVLVDRSQSMPRSQSDAALEEVARAAREAGAGELLRIEFARRPAAQDMPPDPTGTDIEAALDAALAVHARTPLAGAVMISDGLATAGDTERALGSMRQAGLPLLWLALGRPAPAVRIADVLAPDRARVGQRITIAVRVQATGAAPAASAGATSAAASPAAASPAVVSAATAAAPMAERRVRASARSADGDVRSVVAPVAVDGIARLELDAWRAGPLVVDLAVEEGKEASVVARRPAAAAIDVSARTPILYVQGGQGARGALATSLAAGGWPLRVVAAARADALAGDLAGFDAVVLDDVSVGDAGPRFWAALVDSVQQRGLGLLVLGGEHSFARGGYRGSALESLLPVLSEPAALDQPAAVLFLVDKSGSMGEGSGGVDRFALAQRAVLDTARGLGERDELGLVVFDVVPRVLVPLTAAKGALDTLERPWPATPNGGTRLGPAIDAAAAALERTAAPRRLLVLVTDGFVDEAALASARARLAKARVETMAIAVGPDADVSALQRIVGDAGVVLRVDEAAELPAVMRSGLERRRARVERGPFETTQRSPLPFTGGTFDHWPPVDAYLATRARPGARVAVQSERGDPLVAWQRSELGRVAVVTSGLGRWAPHWLAWTAWPRLAGGLADWVAGLSQEGLATIDVSEHGSRLAFDVEQRASLSSAAAAASTGSAASAASTASVLPIASGASAPLASTIPILSADAPELVVRTPAGARRTLQLEPLAPGRWHARMPAAGTGLYIVTAASTFGSVRRLHVLHGHTEDDDQGRAAELARWQTEGLLQRWSPDALARLPAPDDAARLPDRSLLVLALIFFAAGVLVDRAWPAPRGWRALVRRSWRRLARPTALGARE